MRTRIAALTAAVAMFSTVFAGIAWAPRYLLAPQQLLGDCTLPNGGAGSWTGSFAIDSFAVDDGALIATGRLSGTCFAIDNPADPSDDENKDELLSDVPAVASLTSLVTTPTQLTIDIASIQTVRPLVSITLVENDIVLSANPDSKQELAKFGALHRTLQQRTPAEVVSQINAVLGLR